MNLAVRRLRLLSELHARGTITAVAEALSFSPSAVSQQLAQLERETDVPLLEHVGRGVRLTPVARLLLPHVDRILEELDELEATLARAAVEPAGTVSLTTFQSAGLELVPPALNALRRDAPRLRVQVVEAEPEKALPALAAGRVDMVLAEDYPGNPRAHDARVDRQELCQDEILLALPASHPLAGSGEPVPVAGLADDPWVFTLEDTFYAQGAARACTELGGFTPDVRHRANDLTISLALVAAGQAVAFIPELLGRDWPGIAFRRVAERPLKRMVFTAVRRSSADQPAIVAVRAALTREAQVRMKRGARGVYPDSAAASNGPAPAASRRSPTSRPSAAGSSEPDSSESRIQVEPSGSPT
jgi:DNA-binding transcriptional LysR family regulator